MATQAPTTKARARGYLVRGSLNGIKFQSAIFGRSRKFFLLAGDELRQIASVKLGDQLKLTIEADV